MIHPINLLLFPSRLLDILHHLLRTLQILAERLLDDEPAAQDFGVVALFGRGLIVGGELLSEGGELGGRDGELCWQRRGRSVRF